MDWYAGLAGSTVTSWRLSLNAKQELPRLVRFFPRCRVFSMPHIWNAELPMVVTLSGTVMDSSDAHWLNALFSTVSSPSGRMISCMNLQPLKAPEPITVTPSGTT